VTMLVSIPHIGKPQHYFDPWQFTSLCPEDNYTKKTPLGDGCRADPAHGRAGKDARETLRMLDAKPKRFPQEAKTLGG
jgi:hypothetical protein